MSQTVIPTSYILAWVSQNSEVILCREMVFTNLLTLVKLGKILVLKIPKLFLALEYILPILTLSMFLYLAILLVQMRSVEFLKLLMEGNHGIKYCIKDLRLVLQI